MKFPTKFIALGCLATASITYCGNVLALEHAITGQTSATVTPGVVGKARIRLFEENGLSIRIFENSACYAGNTLSSMFAGGDAFLSLLGLVKNTSIGIRETPNSRDIATRGGLGHKAFFREYEVAAGQPLTLRMDHGTSDGPHCGSVGGTIMLEAGKDYEAALELVGGYCLPMVREIVAAPNGSVDLRDLELAPTKACD